MAETFQVEAKFDFKTNAQEVIGNLAKSFRELIGLTSELKKAFEGFDGGTLTKSLKQLKEFSVPTTALDSIRDMSSMMTGMARSATDAAAAVAEMNKAVKDIPRVDRPAIGGGSSSSGGDSKSRPTITDAVSTGVAGYFGAQIAGQLADAAMKPAYDLAKSRTQLLANNTPAEADAAISAARDLQRSVKGTDVQGNIEVYRQLMALTQNPDEARALMGSFLPGGVAMATYNPDAGDYVHQLEAVTKSAEFKGMLSGKDKDGKPVINAAGAQHMGDLLLAMQVVSKGAVGSDTFLRYLRSGGTAAANVDLSEIPYMIPIIQALGPEKAGTGLKGLEQQFSSGKMSQAAVEMLQEMGILSTDKDKYRKLGMGMFMLKPGAMNEKTFEEAVFHPREFMNDTLIPLTQKYNLKNYGKAYANGTEEQKRALDTATLQQLASRIPGGTYMGEILRNELLSERDNQAFGKLDPAAIKKTMADSPAVAIQSFFGALKDLTGLLGGAPFKDAISILNTFTGALNALSKSAEKHPAAAASASAGGTDLLFGAIAGGGLELGGKALGKYGFGTAGAALRIAGFAASRFAVAFAVDRILTGALEAITGQDPAKWIDKHIPGAQALDRWLNKATHGAIGHDYDADGDGSVQKQRFLSGQSGDQALLQPITLHVNLDGRKVAESVTHHQARMMRPGVMLGTNDPDYLSMPMPAGARTI